MYIIKHDGRKEFFDFNKIQICIDLALDGLNLDGSVLSSKIQSYIKDGMSTTDIQDALIVMAISFALPDAFCDMAINVGTPPPSV